MAVLFFILWVVLNGRLTLEIVLIGLLVAALIQLFAGKVLARETGSFKRLARNLPLTFHYLFVLVLEIIKASVAVMRVAFSRKVKPEPCIIEFRSGFEDEFRNVILANSITLTPGTYTIFLEKDRFVIHCLRKEYADGMGDSQFIQLLRKMR